MTMGQRIRAARLAAGLSQRELAGEEITRNMLSGLEHDTANPSIATLKYLSARLGKPISYFLGEDGGSGAVTAFAEGNYRRCLELLEGEEKAWLEPIALLREAAQAVEDSRIPYAVSLLNKLDGLSSPLLGVESVRKAALLRMRCGLPSAIPEDGALLCKAETALSDGRTADALRYLQALDERNPRWEYLMGECLFRAGDYAAAKEHYRRCEETGDVRARLEICFRELGDYKMAYYYAKLT